MNFYSLFDHVLLSAKMLLCTKNNLLHADNRQEYDVREERRRELEFLEKVGSFCLMDSTSQYFYVNDDYLLSL